jgi:hypothetical protein
MERRSTEYEDEKDASLNLVAVAFPALIIADDGWIDLWSEPQQIFTASAIATYNKRSVVIYDTQNQAWQVEQIVPGKKMSMIDRILNRKLQVQVKVKPIDSKAFPAIVNALDKAIGADDDILTQDTDANVLRAAVRKADSFKTLIQALREAHVIEW